MGRPNGTKHSSLIAIWCEALSLATKSQNSEASRKVGITPSFGTIFQYFLTSLSFHTFHWVQNWYSSCLDVPIGANSVIIQAFLGFAFCIQNLWIAPHIRGRDRTASSWAHVLYFCTFLTFYVSHLVPNPYSLCFYVSMGGVHIRKNWING